MRARGRLLAASGVIAVNVLLAAQSFAADTPTGIVVTGPSGAGQVMAPDALASLPTVRVTVSTEPGHGPPQRMFEGPLLWTILEKAHLVDAAKFRDEVRQIVLVTGSDGYTATIALGEISPEFEDKQVVLAERMDGEPLGAEHPRIVVPGDKRGGRGVHDVVRIQLDALPNEKH